MVTISFGVGMTTLALFQNSVSVACASGSPVLPLRMLAALRRRGESVRRREIPDVAASSRSGVGVSSASSGQAFRLRVPTRFARRHAPLKMTGGGNEIDIE